MTRLPGGDLVVAVVSRAAAVVGIASLVAMLPWLARRDPAYTVLRARYADLEATPAALASVRAELGLQDGPVASLLTWWGDVSQGDLGTSWVSGGDVAPGVVAALQVSLTLMAYSLAVAVVIAVVAVGLVLRRARRARRARSHETGLGAGTAALTSLPEFVLAILLLLVGAVWLDLVAPYGWSRPSSVVLPALALGIPAGGLLARLATEAVVAVLAERWVRTWRTTGWSPWEVDRAVLRRALPAVLPQVGLVVVGLTGGAVAVEQVFAIPGLGRTLLGGAAAQDLPVLQAGLLALLVVALAVGAVAGLARRVLLGPALRLGSLQVPVSVATPRRRDRLVVVAVTGTLALVVLAGLPRDPNASAHPRLAPPGPGLPFGADASGRDLFARVAHGALPTMGTAVAVAAICLVVGLAVGLLVRWSTGLVEVANAAPPVLVGLAVAGLTGPSLGGAAAAVALVAWAPLAAHTSALLVEARAQPHVAVLPTLGAGRARILLAHLLPAVLGPVTRHAALRVPGITLALAGLGFLGLGPGQPSPQWGRLLAEGTPYLERAPWSVLAPTLALVLLGVLAVSSAALGGLRRPGRSQPTSCSSSRAS